MSTAPAPRSRRGAAGPDAPRRPRVLAVIARTARIVVGLPRFAVYFSWQLIVANARVAWEVMTPGLSMTAAIVRHETRCRTDVEVMLFANAITLTPGTLSLEIEPDTRAIHVHAFYTADREAFHADLERMEDEILRLVR